MPDVQPAKYQLRHLDVDEHAFNAIGITESFLLSEQCKADRYSFVQQMGGMLRMYELIQEMANAVSRFECSYERSPWNGQISMDWESCCTLYTTRVISHVLSSGKWPDLNTMLHAAALPTNGTEANG